MKPRAAPEPTWHQHQDDSTQCHDDNCHLHEYVDDDNDDDSEDD